MIRLRKPLPLILLCVTLLSSLLGASLISSGEGQPAVMWSPKTVKAIRFHLEFEESQTLTALDSRGRPVTKRPDVALPRALSALVQWKWKRIQPAYLDAELTLERLDRLELATSGAATKSSSGIKIGIRFLRGDGKVEAKLRRAEVAKLGDLVKSGSAKSDTALREFKKLIEDAVSDLLGFFPPGDSLPDGIGQKWKLRPRHRTLFNKTTLVEVRELETVKEARKNGKRVGLQIEGAIRQRLAGAPSDAQRTQGLFPGTVKWTHDVTKGFPIRFVAKKTAKIPIPDDQLPIVRTLTHQYLLKFELPQE